MKNLLKSHIRVTLITLLIAFCLPQFVQAQEDSTGSYTSALEMKMFKNNEEGRTYTIKLTGTSAEDQNYPLFEATVNLYSVGTTGEELIGTIKTDYEGKGSLVLSKDQKYLKDETGMATVTAKFPGSDAVAASDATVTFKEMKMEISMIDNDSLHSIDIKANAIGTNGELIPLKETTVNLYVQGLVSKLKIGDCFLETGEGTFEFPNNIPGDKDGNLKIFVRLEENEEFGDVEKMEIAAWGGHKKGWVEPERTMWSSGAPLWMIITLTILLLGVWSHYLYAVIQLIKIRNEGKKIEKDQEV